MTRPYRTTPDTLGAIRADLDAMLGRVDAFEAAGDTSVELDAVATLARMGREMYARRALARAVEHATAMLPAIGLPQLVTPDFAPLDPVAIGEAVEAAVAALDAMDGDADAEPWLGWTGAALGRADAGDTLDREDDSEEAEDDGTAEPSLASPERHPYVPTVSWGPYTARGGDEGQLRWADGGQHDRENDPCDGPIDDDELDDDGLSRGEGDSVDDEPNLGAPIGNGDQEHWAQGSVMSNDPEADDSEHDDDRTAEDSAMRVWVFGPSRREVAHV